MFLRPYCESVSECSKPVSECLSVNICLKSLQSVTEPMSVTVLKTLVSINLYVLDSLLKEHMTQDFLICQSFYLDILGF